MAQALAQGYLWRKPEVALKGCGICIGGGDIAWLHGDKLLVGLKVIVLREDTGTDEFLLEDLYEVQEVLGLATTYIIYGIGRNGQAVIAILALGSSLHHAHNALNDIIYIGEVAAAVAIVEYLDGFALQQLVGKAKVGHIRTTGRAIDGKEAQACGGDIVELRIAVGEELVTLLGGGIQRHGVVYTVIRAKWHLLVATINRTTRGVHKVLDALVIDN